MAGRKSDFTLTKLDDLFTTQAQRDEEQLSKIRDIPLELIDDFPDHPFKVRDDEDMMQLVESVKERGVITPAKIKVLLVEPEKYPKEIVIDDSLEAMQEVVGGDIEEYMPYDDDVAIICNEEGKMRGLPLNRAVYVQDNDKKEMVDIICGKFFICYAPPESESFQSLPDDMMKKYKEQFKYPERFSKEVGGNIVAEPFKPKSKDYER